MDRRRFLGKAALAVGLVAAGGRGAGVPGSPPVCVMATGDGRLYRSADGGATWQLGLALGASRPVLFVRPEAGGFVADVGLDGDVRAARFSLRSADGRTWRTAPARPGTANERARRDDGRA